MHSTLFLDDQKDIAKLSSFCLLTWRYDKPSVTRTTCTPIYITKTCLFKYNENFPPKNENYQIKILIFLKFLLKT